MITKTSPSVLLQEWETLTVAETEAIESSNWDWLTTIQREKASLKTRLDAEPMKLGAALRHQVSKLMEMERRNFESLGMKMADVEEQLAELEQSATRLRRVQGSYAGGGRDGVGFSTTA
ncbi:MAG: hypothetical protein RI897_1508 [Verrucomicrobiota bacterium]|jgi:hypothetical protein